VAAVERAVARPGSERVETALSLLQLTRELELHLDLDRAQELVYEALSGDGPSNAELLPLAAALGLAVEPN
jgi:hypothetical protein